MKASRKTFKESAKSKSKSKTAETHKVEIDALFDVVWLDGHEVIAQAPITYLLCPLCDEKVETSALFERHIKRMHQHASKKQKHWYKVEIDELEGGVFLDNKAVETEEVSYYACPICAVEVESAALFEVHVESVHNQPLLPDVESIPEHVHNRSPLPNVESMPEHVHPPTPLPPPDSMEPLDETSETAYIRHTVSYDEESKVLFLSGEEVLKNDKGRYVCPACGKGAFMNIKTFTVHVKAEHNYEKPYKCTVCKASFNVNQTLYYHVLWVHNKVLKFECFEPGCGKAFSTKHGLKFHSTMHREPQVPCTKCRRKFRNASYLTEHMKRTHVTQKRFLCPECPDRFTTEAARQAHGNVKHRGLPKGFKCNNCWRLFERNLLLQNHNAREHPNSIKCHLCAETFSKNEEAGDHYRTTHAYSEEDNEWLLKTAHERIDPLDNKVVMD